MDGLFHGFKTADDFAMNTVAVPVQLRRSRRVREWAEQGVAAVGIGSFIAWWRGFSLLDPSFVVAFLSSSVILIGPIMAQRYHVDRRSTHVLRDAVRRACSTTTCALIVSLLWINLQWSGELLLPPWGVLASALLLAFAATVLAGTLTILS